MPDFSMSNNAMCPVHQVWLKYGANLTPAFARICAGICQIYQLFSALSAFAGKSLLHSHLAALDCCLHKCPAAEQRPHGFSNDPKHASRPETFAKGALAFSLTKLEGICS